MCAKLLLSTHPIDYHTYLSSCAPLSLVRVMHGGNSAPPLARIPNTASLHYVCVAKRRISQHANPHSANILVGIAVAANSSVHVTEQSAPFISNHAPKHPLQQRTTHASVEAPELVPIPKRTRKVHTAPPTAASSTRSRRCYSAPDSRPPPVAKRHPSECSCPGGIYNHASQRFSRTTLSLSRAGLFPSRFCTTEHSSSKSLENPI